MDKNKKVFSVLNQTDIGLRLDVFIASQVKDISRTGVQNLIEENNILVNQKVPKASYKMVLGDKIEMTIALDLASLTAEPKAMELDIRYEDGDLLVINKPQGLVVHPSLGHHNDTLVNGVMYYCKDQLSDINGEFRPGIVHRLDKDTSGLLIVVKNNYTHIKISEMLSRHEILRQYRGVVYGTVEVEKGTIDAPIGRANNDRRRMVVREGGKEAKTNFQVVERFNKATDLSIQLETGRTHQIRAHMTYIKHPVVGDPLYAPRRDHFNLQGQALHSQKLQFSHPRTGQEILVETELPEYYQALRNQLSLL